MPPESAESLEHQARTSSTGQLEEENRARGDRLGVPLLVHAAAAAAAPADVPIWWFWVISLYNIPLGIANICIGSILLPPLIQKVVGAEGKEAALGLVISMVSLIHTIEPFLGALSDRARCGCRKRVFIIVGQSCTCCGIAGMWAVEHAPEW